MYTTHAAALTMVADISVSRKVFFTRSNFFTPQLFDVLEAEQISHVQHQIEELADDRRQFSDCLRKPHCDMMKKKGDTPCFSQA